MMIVISDDLEARAREVARNILTTPFTKRTWSELLYLLVGIAVAGVGFAFVALTLAAGTVFAVTFVGLAIIALSVRGARGIGGIQRDLAYGLLGEQIDVPAQFAPRPGFFGWLQSALRDRAGWRAVAYLIAKVPL